MIRTVPELNLGQDTARIKDPRDAERQHATANAILSRFFARTARDRREVQMLADEVGMGKTFVALAVAHAVLDAHRRSQVSDLTGCYQKVLVITPQNGALYNKWGREVAEFVGRCFPKEYQPSTRSWFAPVLVRRLDDLVGELRRPGNASVIVANTSIFGGGKFTDYNLKRRLVLSQLFRLWGIRFRTEDRERLLRGAPQDWPQSAGAIDHFTFEQSQKLPLAANDVYAALNRLAAGSGGSGEAIVERLLSECRQIAAPFIRNRGELFKGIETDLTLLYRRICEDMLRSDLPLVIVDEAHNWKNGPSSNANGYKTFRELIAPRTRRVLLLTATPFQLRPEEMLNVLDVVGHIKPTPLTASAQERIGVLKSIRDKSISPVLRQSSWCSGRFQKAWARLPRTIHLDELRRVWLAESLKRARAALSRLVKLDGAVNEKLVEECVSAAVESIDPDLRQLMREGLRLYAYNQHLSVRLGQFVIRHRRGTDHRLFRVGAEYRSSAEEVAARPDAHLLHFAPGIDVRGDGELPQYLLMRCISEVKEGRGRSSLGAALTGCYSTLLESAEGKQVSGSLRGTTAGGMYLDLLLGMVNQTKDPQHPKLQQVVDRAVETWQCGEKTLIFCFRVNTAIRLRQIIEDRIRAELRRRRKRLPGGENALKALKARLSARDRDLVGLGLDRPLLSFLWYSPVPGHPAPFTIDDLRIADAELAELATLALERGVDLSGDRIDRVFLFRATEHLAARRLLAHARQPSWRRLLGNIASPDWLDAPYGVRELPTADEAQVREQGSHESLATDERGLHRAYRATRTPAQSAVSILARELRSRRERARQQGDAVLDGYSVGASLWFGRKPLEFMDTGHAAQHSDRHSNAKRTLAELNRQLSKITFANGNADWTTRRLVVEAMRRTVFRESALLRLLPTKHEREEARWGELLAERFVAPMEGQHESLADRVAAFLEDFHGTSGSVLEAGSPRRSLLDATRLRDQQFVALVTGEGSGGQSRERVFAGFNTPLLPEILICTSVGQEGIDLHRHCRHVVHYDLAWNPAVLEQRTGRVDRIGSKTFRERSLASAKVKPYLEVGVPFLAGTYDERMFEELRLRAQTFEVLTGGDFAVDNAEGNDDRGIVERHEAELSVVPLPEEMVEELRVRLHVWREGGSGTTQRRGESELALPL